jgi:hypothetical protein
LVKQVRTARLIRVELPSKPEIYSAFGGAVNARELAAGQMVSVWFQECKWPKTGQPVSAYFQVISVDPNDKP